MHPSPRFRIADRETMARIVRAEGFGTLVVDTDAGLRAVHVPLLLQGERLLFHVSRGNAVHAALTAGGEALVVVNGPHGYVSPDWYGLSGRVPTWNYVAVELNGPVSPLAREELACLLDALAELHESRLAPKPAWTRAQIDPSRYEALLDAIAGFALDIREWRGTAKIDQDKPVEVRARIGDALEARGERAMADLMRTDLPPP
jgi:transcriptional regulator